MDRDNIEKVVSLLVLITFMFFIGYGIGVNKEKRRLQTFLNDVEHIYPVLKETYKLWTWRE